MLPAWFMQELKLGLVVFLREITGSRLRNSPDRRVLAKNSARQGGWRPPVNHIPGRV